mmetsp:Transcript_10333/g.32691  ORF Transcript_10333/g.32691 Transcript_10333/m.32691 type:complete len:345 (-) Transcript_10333:548-1582(-)
MSVLVKAVRANQATQACSVGPTRPAKKAVAARMVCARRVNLTVAHLVGVGRGRGVRRRAKEAVGRRGSHARGSLVAQHRPEPAAHRPPVARKDAKDVGAVRRQRVRREDRLQRVAEDAGRDRPVGLAARGCDASNGNRLAQRVRVGERAVVVRTAKAEEGVGESVDDVGAQRGLCPSEHLRVLLRVARCSEHQHGKDVGQVPQGRAGKGEEGRVSKDDESKPRVDGQVCLVSHQLGRHQATAVRQRDARAVRDRAQVCQHIAVVYLVSLIDDQHVAGHCSSEQLRILVRGATLADDQACRQGVRLSVRVQREVLTRCSDGRQQVVHQSILADALGAKEKQWLAS